jgi:TRAP-type C4-dicarboxylate transport system substrate-binding protein
MISPKDNVITVNRPERFSEVLGLWAPVLLEPDQILLGLRNGMIDALPVPAFLANFNQVATYAPYMLDLKWAPVTGALVLTEKAWKQLDRPTQQWLIETSERAGHTMRAASRAEDEATIRAMVEKQGLKVVTLSAPAERQFREEVARIYPRIRGTLVPAPIFDMTVETLESGDDSPK